MPFYINPLKEVVVVYFNASIHHLCDGIEKNQKHSKGGQGSPGHVSDKISPECSHLT